MRFASMLVASVLLPLACTAQSALERRIASAGDTPAQFRFAAR